MQGSGIETATDQRQMKRVLCSLSQGKYAIKVSMKRLNVTLNQETYEALERQAKQTRKTCAKVAEDLLSESLAQRDAATRRKKLVADYRAGRADARAVLNDLELPQLELLDDEGA